MTGVARQTQTKPTATSKEWMFAEKQWYCAECGIVSAKEVARREKHDETGICRCGREITKTTF